MAGRLDSRLVGRIAERTGIKDASVKQQASRRAGRLGVRSEVALILWAQELGLGTTRDFNKLPSDLQAQVQAARPALQVSASRGRQSGRTSEGGQAPGKPSSRAALGAAIDLFIEDVELRDRCGDLLRGAGKFDRVFREATTVLENRVRTLTGLSKNQEKNSDALLARSLHPSQALLRVSDHEDEQEGFYNLVKGVFLLFRNPHHHQLTESYSRGDAFKLCGLVDSILLTLGKAKRVT